MGDENLEKVRKGYEDAENIKAFYSQLETLAERAHRVAKVIREAERLSENDVLLRYVPDYFKTWVLGGFDPEKKEYTENAMYNYISFLSWENWKPNLKECMQKPEIIKDPKRIYDDCNWSYSSDSRGIIGKILNFSKEEYPEQVKEIINTFVEDTKEIIEKSMRYSPLYSPESFFVLSLAHLPRFYIEKVYPGLIGSEAFDYLEMEVIFKGPENKYDILGPKKGGKLDKMINVLTNLCRNVNYAYYEDSYKNVFFRWLQNTWEDWKDRKKRILYGILNSKGEFIEFAKKLREEYHKEAKIISVSDNYATIKIRRGDKIEVVSTNEKASQDIDYPLLLSYAAPQWMAGIGDFNKNNENLATFKVYLIE